MNQATRYVYLIMLTLFMQLSGTLAQVRVAKNIGYGAAHDQWHTLNIYHGKTSQKSGVVVFIHGGSWSSGKKETYWWLGRNLAKSGKVAVIINYPLAPGATYREMAMASATAVKWTRDSIAAYGGNPERVFVMGHSAGGHLSELINADPGYFRDLGIKNPIKGIILNDAFGLDMEEYLSQAAHDHYYTDFIRTFSNDSRNWKVGSPLFYVDNIKNPHLVLYGTASYDAIKLQSERLVKELRARNVPASLIPIEGKKHVGMISQMIWGSNRLYQQIDGFMQAVK